MRLVRLSLLLVHSSNSTLRIYTKYGIPFLAKEAGFFLLLRLEITKNLKNAPKMNNLHNNKEKRSSFKEFSVNLQLKIK